MSRGQNSLWGDELQIIEDPYARATRISTRSVDHGSKDTNPRFEDHMALPR